VLSVITRDALEEREDRSLALYAVRGRLSRGRRHPETSHPYRTEFQRDRDRIVHSTAFRRLEYKTQVFIYHEGDHYRNRLTHSLEVAVLGRTLARTLRLNEDLVESIALAHDLGHSPFGHSGEQVLNDLMSEHGGFEHNRQSLRVVEVIEHRYPSFRGLNLSWETREGIAKHVTEYDAPTSSGYGPARFPSLEAQLVCLADEIAYTNHDLDDGLSSGLITLRTLKDVPLWEEHYLEAERLLAGKSFRLVCAATIRRLINLLIEDAARTTFGRIEEAGIASPDDAREAASLTVGLSEGVSRPFQELKDYLHENLYRHYKVRLMAVKAERILTELFALYVSDQSLLPSRLRVHLEGDTPERLICDYLAGMTDRYAIREYRKMFDVGEGA
jgi:dGTPase